LRIDRRDGGWRGLEGGRRGGRLGRADAGGEERAGHPIDIAAQRLRLAARGTGAGKSRNTENPAAEKKQRNEEQKAFHRRNAPFGPPGASRVSCLRP